MKIIVFLTVLDKLIRNPCYFENNIFFFSTWPNPSSANNVFCYCCSFYVKFSNLYFIHEISSYSIYSESLTFWILMIGNIGKRLTIIFDIYFVCDRHKIAPSSPLMISDHIWPLYSWRSIKKSILFRLPMPVRLWACLSHASRPACRQLYGRDVRNLYRARNGKELFDDWFPIAQWFLYNYMCMFIYLSFKIKKKSFYMQNVLHLNANEAFNMTTNAIYFFYYSVLKTYCCHWLKYYF